MQGWPEASFYRAARWAMATNSSFLGPKVNLGTAKRHSADKGGGEKSQSQKLP